MRILNIHAGLSEKHIIYFLEKIIIKDAINLEEEEEKISLYSDVYEKKKFWIYF